MKSRLSPKKVDRLYWLDELTDTQIARKFDCTPQNISQYRKRHGIPGRPNLGKRHNAECCEEGCEAPTCQIKRWFKSGIKIVWTIRCAKHYHLWWRAIQRIVARRRPKQKRWTGPKRYESRPTLRLGELSTIVKED